MITEHPIDRRVWTDDELLALPGHEHWRLIDGELQKMSPAGAQHGIVTARLLAAVLRHAEEKNLGIAVDSPTGFRLSPSHCFAADVAFVRRERIAKLMPDRLKFFQGAPDFAIEVKSPGNSLAEILRKIELLTEHGTELIWLFLPNSREVRVFCGSAEFETKSQDDVLDGGNVLPGLRVAIRKIFADPVFE